MNRQVRRFWIIALATLATAACEGPDAATPEAGVAMLESALPTAEQMLLRLPTGDFLVPEQATFYAFTREITVGVNRFVVVITNVLEDVLEQPPTETDGETYAIWGPHTDPLSPATWRVRVDLVAPGTFEYVVDAWPKALDAAAAQVVLSGAYTRGQAEGEGTGRWTYDLTAAHALDPIANDSIGTVAVSYELGDARLLEVEMTEVQGPHQANALTALYRYTEAADRSGTFDFIANMDIHADDHPELDRRELLQVRSRWLPTGPGRADVVATHGDLREGQQVDLTECWSDAFIRVYIRYGFVDQIQEDGDPAECAYADRQLPVFEDFDPHAFAEGELLAAIPAPADFDAAVAPVEHPAPQRATYYDLTQSVVQGLNAYTTAVIGLLQDVTRYPPSSCDPESCTWGPWTDWNTNITTLLVIRRSGESRFLFELSGKPFGAPEDLTRALIRGGFTAEDAVGNGEGWFDYDFDAVALLNPEETTRGQFRAEFSRQGGDARLAVRLTGVALSEDDDTPSDAQYHVFVSADGGGSLDFRFPADVNLPEGGFPAREIIEAKVRWIAGGAGTANARVSDGDLGDDRLAYGVECWDDTAAQTHAAFNYAPLDGEQRPDIDAEACVFADWEDPDLPPFADELL